MAITDQFNERIIEVTLDKQIVWQYGATGVSGNGPNQLNNPNCSELLESGHILICDENNNRAIEVTRDGDIVWQYESGDPSINDPVSGVAFASRLKDGHTLITDSNRPRIVEIDGGKNVVWEKKAGVINQTTGGRALAEMLKASAIRAPKQRVA